MSEKTEHIKVLTRIIPMVNKNCLLTVIIFAFLKVVYMFNPLTTRTELCLQSLLVFVVTSTAFIVV